MKPHFDFGMSFNPSHYAWELVERLGFKEPSTEWVDIVLEHLGLRRKPYSGDPFFPTQQIDETAQGIDGQIKLFEDERYGIGSPSRRPQRKPIDAALWEREIVFVDTDFPLERQRLAICHEVGHFYLPWHEGLSHWKDGCIVEPPGAEQGEVEASRFAADLLMPPPFFREDIESLTFGLRSVERLSWRYLTSLEATARHYVHLSQRSCAFVVIEALPREAIPKDGSWLRVRYCIPSPSFKLKHFISPKTEIASDTPIARASLASSSPVFVGSRPVITEEVPGWVLGLRPERRLIVHCSPWGREGDVLVLVEEHQGNQGRLF